MVSVPDRQARRVSGRVPVMRETRYDLTSSLVIAAALILIGSVILLITVWLSNLLPDRTVLTPTMVVGESASEQGDESETLEVEVPEDPSDDPSLANDQQETRLEEVVERMVSATGAASQFKSATNFSDAESAGTAASAVGDTGRPLGAGGGRNAGLLREQRWKVEFGDRRSLQHYAQMLDFFGIEIGVVFQDGRVIYVGNLSGGYSMREAQADGSDKRLFMSWEQGERIQADLKLLGNAGVGDVTGGRIVHFYSPETETLLANLEKEYAGRPPEEIRLTRFRAIGSPGEFQFVVEAQKYR